MPPKKVLKLDTGQRKLTALFKAPVTVPVCSMQGLWELLIKHHKEELPDLIKLSQIALTLPLHTASWERVFSQQNLILTKQRSRLAPATSDKLLRTRLASNAGVILNFEDCLQRWHWLTKRLSKQNWQSERIHYKIKLILFLSCFLPIQVY